MGSDATTILSQALRDRYRILRELGSGGMATVFLAEDLRHDRHVAVKVLRPDFAATLGSARFLDEIPDAVVESTRARRAPHRPARAESGGPSLDYSYAQTDPGDGAEVAPGLRVRHPIFGVGTILAVIGDAAGQKLRIRFERGGVKTVLVRYANLELG